MEAVLRNDRVTKSEKKKAEFKVLCVNELNEEFKLVMEFDSTSKDPTHTQRLIGSRNNKADRGADGLLHRAGLLPGRHFDRGADHGRAAADDREGRHRPGLVRHLRRAGGRNGADHAAGGLQPVRAAGHDQEGDQLPGPACGADVPADGAGRAADLLRARHRDLAATTDGGLNHGHTGIAGTALAGAG